MALFDGLCEDEFEEALLHLEENLPSDAAGVSRQIRARGLESLSKNQRYVFEQEIRPAMWEGCGGCKDNKVVAGRDYCGSCEIRLGGSQFR